MAEKGKAPSKNHKWDSTKKRWVVKSFEERQKGRPFYLQGKDNPIRQVHDFVRNVNAEKKLRSNAAKKANPPKEEPKKSSKLKTKGPKVKSVGTVDFNVNTASGLASYNKALKASKTNKSKTNKDKDKSTTEALHGKQNKANAEKQAWLKKTRNSPAAKSKNSRGKPTWSDDERWALQQKHREWKESRKKGNKKKDNLKTNKKPTNPVEAQSGLKKKKKKKATNPIGLQFGR